MARGATQLGFVDILTAAILLGILLYAATLQFSVYNRPPAATPTSRCREPLSSLPDAAKERLDHYLVRTGFASSRRVAQELVERGLVRINGRRSKKSEIVGADDRIEVASTNRRAVIEPNADLALEVLHEDASVIVVNKAGGVPCHPLNADERDTVMNAVVARFPEIATVGDKPLEGGLVHRLDNGTSGALLIARNRGTFDKLREAIRAGRIARRYEALVAGALESKIEIDAPIAHHAKNARKMIVGDPSSANPKRAGRRRESLSSSRFAASARSPCCQLRRRPAAAIRFACIWRASGFRSLATLCTAVRRARRSRTDASGCICARSRSTRRQSVTSR